MGVPQRSSSSAGEDPPGGSILPAGRTANGLTDPPAPSFIFVQPTFTDFEVRIAARMASVRREILDGFLQEKL